jgi:uncharacterized membrane protein YfcA
LINLGKKNPVVKERTIIDWEIVAIFVPGNLFGAVIGAMVNKMFPNFIIDVCLFIFRVFIITQLYMQGIKIYK